MRTRASGQPIAAVVWQTTAEHGLSATAERPRRTLGIELDVGSVRAHAAAAAHAQPRPFPARRATRRQRAPTDAERGTGRSRRRRQQHLGDDGRRAQVFGVLASGSTPVTTSPARPPPAYGVFTLGLTFLFLGLYVEPHRLRGGRHSATTSPSGRAASAISDCVNQLGLDHHGLLCKMTCAGPPSCRSPPTRSVRSFMCPLNSTTRVIVCFRADLGANQSLLQHAVCTDLPVSSRVRESLAYLRPARSRASRARALMLSRSPSLTSASGAGGVLAAATHPAWRCCSGLRTRLSREPGRRQACANR